MAIASTSAHLAGLQALGQSVWLDDISRKMLEDGSLQRLIDEDGLQGMTSNPSIFQKAISAGADYDEETGTLVATGQGIEGIYQGLTVADIRRALDLFRPVYDRTGGLDGYVSLEVSPLLALDTEGTIREGKQLWELLGRPNAMIKVPGTPEGLPAIEELLYSGINVNVTLLFSVDAYEQVAQTYIKALARRAAEGKAVDHIASVASFFISRIDVEVDKRLDALIKASSDDPGRVAKLKALKGKVAIANAKNSYVVYEKEFGSPQFLALKAKGAKVQRLLWASVGTKNPDYPDTLYIDELIGPDTVSTMPRPTYDAFKSHGHASPALLKGMDEAKVQIEQLSALGVNFQDVLDKLLRDGVKIFADSFGQLMVSIREKQADLIRKARVGGTAILGDYKGDVEATLADLEKIDAVKRLWAKDASLFKSEHDHAKIIGNALGWLTVADVVKPEAGALSSFSDEIAAAGFGHIVVMGMGGSSLCVEVIRRTNVPVAGHPLMVVLDSTVPATIRRIEKAIDPAHTLFIVASKSGTTTEPSVFYAYFFDLVKKLKGDRAGENFIAITDPGTKMEADARRDGFRRIFLNPSDIGGRYSALSFFGMVPAALMGLDVGILLDRADTVIKASKPETPIRQNQGAVLGATLGALALKGRNKVTLVTPPPFDALGLWIEQLIAESTGKEGKGIVPIAGEPLTSPDFYGNDRVFVLIRTLDGPAVEDHPNLIALSKAGHPVIELIVADTMDLAAEFFVWEIATPLAGQRLGINPFDQPNVQESKDNTKALLAEYTAKGALPRQETVATYDDLTFSTDAKNKAALLKDAGTKQGRDLAVAVLKAHLSRLKPGDYLAITQYFDEKSRRDEALQILRVKLRDTYKVATTTGYGPRFLHSTGQLHKGGPDTGVFLQLTAQDGEDLPIPNEKFGFATLVQAQALGDFQSLTSRDRRALSINLGTDVDKGFGILADLIRYAIA
jgi:transaldolase/glucose-6-phosphate isomerase